MALSNPASYLSSLISAGADMMTNLYYIEFVAPSSMNTDGEPWANLTVRAKDFKAPAATHPTHTVDFMTTSVALASPGVDITKSFDLTFRVDANYDVYRYLKFLQNNNMDGNTEAAANVVEHQEGDGYVINVYTFSSPATVSLESYEDSKAYIPEKHRQQLYKFKNCWVSSVSGLDYSYNSTDPQEVTATIKFFDYLGPEDFLKVKKVAAKEGEE